MTLKDTQWQDHWLEIRRLEGLLIDSKDAEVMSRYVSETDPYGIYDEDINEIYVGGCKFARRPGSDIWVAFHDLPDTVENELYRRFWPRALRHENSRIPSEEMNF